MNGRPMETVIRGRWSKTRAERICSEPVIPTGRMAAPLRSAISAVPPIAEYGHGLGCAVAGGYVYRGARQPAMKGIYLFGDYCSGTIFGVPAGGGTLTPMAVAQTGLMISSFGEGEDGEIYLVDLRAGGLYRVVVG